MTRPVVVTEPGQGHRIGNVEFLARTVDTPFFNLGIVVLAPGQGVSSHVHDDEDDSFLVLEGTLSSSSSATTAGRCGPARARSCSCRPARRTRSPTRGRTT